MDSSQYEPNITAFGADLILEHAYYGVSTCL